MCKTISIIFATSFILATSTLKAEPFPYEYKAGSAESAALVYDKASEPIVRKWALKNRPQLYKLAFNKEEKKKADGFGGLISLAISEAARTDLYLDYYLNQQAEAGWEPFIIEEKRIFLRRKRTE
jgi:hypothetical protein